MLRVLSILVPCLASIAQAGSGLAEPMDLTDTRARLVHVQFERLEPDRGAGTERAFSEPFVARLRPAHGDGRLTVTVPGSVVERLMSSQNAQPGSFSEFVWTFDPDSGEVVSAAVSGVLNQTIDLGIFDTRVDASIQIALDTLAPAGSGRPRNLMGHTLSRFCTDAADEDCQIVEPVDYDATTGFVRAVGALSAKTSFITTRTLAPFGKAIFTEIPNGLVSSAESAQLPAVSAR